ncbi:MAG: hypothetical protein RSK76_07735 [Clostridia bacterium]
MSGPCDQGQITLTVPAKQQMMLVIRLTTAGVLARAGLSMDAMDDMKMAAEEACATLIRSSGCEQLTVSYAVEERAFRLHAQTSACSCRDCLTGLTDEEIAVVRCVLLSLTDDVSLTFDDRCLRAIDLRKQLPM